MSRDLSKQYPGSPCASIRLWVPLEQDGSPGAAESVGSRSSYEGKLPRGLATLLLVYPLMPDGLSPEMDEQLMEIARKVVMAPHFPSELLRESVSDQTKP